MGQHIARRVQPGTLHVASDHRYFRCGIRGFSMTNKKMKHAGSISRSWLMMPASFRNIHFALADSAALAHQPMKLKVTRCQISSLIAKKIQDATRQENSRSASHTMPVIAFFDQPLYIHSHDAIGHPTHA
jgi:hypothetical protein